VVVVVVVVGSGGSGRRRCRGVARVIAEVVRVKRGQGGERREQLGRLGLDVGDLWVVV
jgi:hypothetical protein